MNGKARGWVNLGSEGYTTNWYQSNWYTTGPVACQLALPNNARIHNVFHVSLLKKYIHEPTHMID